MTVLAAALLGFAPMASHAADYPDGLISDSGSNSLPRATDESPAMTDCAISDREHTTSMIETVRGDYEQIDVSSALLEDLLKIAPE